MENKLQIVLGSGNVHKTEEFNALSAKYNIEFVPLKGEFNPDENGKTFTENARIKAKEASKTACGKYYIADDSGLCVDYLNGEPGIHSARYEKTAELRIDKLLNALKNDTKRNAKFVCALCLVDEKGNILREEIGEVKGKITYQKIGNEGFGYDPVFEVEGLNKTMAQLSREEKNTLSHRGKALTNMLKWLCENLKG